MNEDNQNPNQNENPNQGSNSNNDGNINSNYYGNQNQNQFGNSNQFDHQNQYVNPNQYPNQNQYANSNQYPNQDQNVNPNQNPGQYNDQDKYWNPNQNQYQGQTPNQFVNQNQYGNQPNQFGQQNQYGNQPNQFGQQNQYGNQPNQFGNQQNQYGNPNQFANQNPKPKKPKSKKLTVTIISAIFALLLVGGGVFAFFNMQKTPKDRLLLAELNSWGQLNKAFESRYQPELEWAKKAETTPTEYTYQVGASVDGEFYSYEDEMVAEILSNSSLTLGVQMDPNKQVLKADLGADVNGVKIDNLSAYITTKELMFGFPFTDDILQLKDEDFGNFMKSLDPYYEGTETLGLSDWMGKNVFSKENQDYLVKEYLLFFYNSIPQEAFKEASEDVNVFGSNLQANKISMELSGDQIRDVLVKVLEKAKNDPKFEDIILETVKNATGAAGSFEDDFDININEGLDTAIAELKNTDIPTGINYTVWVNADTVVKSELEIGEFKVEGTRQFTTEKVQWDYTLEMEGESLYFAGDLSSNNGKFNDEVTLLDDYGTGFTYEGSEDLNGRDRTFYRTLYFQDEWDEFELFWEGNSSYKGDSMEGEHRFGIGSYEYDIAITVDEAGSFIKNVDIPSNNLVDIGSMSSDEIERYMTEDFLTAAQSWAMNLYFELGLY
ncbi:proline-rich domain-containing protein [Ureibacillus manganicus]|uniref:Uncharacterized protein n=1 Tax=Ureibacillus manganicus DSM 26584 TaxID=1384049 RepID=A0A0A3I517_9BACL|nr:proline-rich domain-containing protein [Ureibacillus manganicus]KGR79804.1 hypothetical protein CD29_04520 [Ureibacillus manganicus DSM 26584]